MKVARNRAGLDCICCGISFRAQSTSKLAQRDGQALKGSYDVKNACDICKSSPACCAKVTLTLLSRAVLLVTRIVLVFSSGSETHSSFMCQSRLQQCAICMLRKANDQVEALPIGA